MRVKGINYDAGTVLGGNWRPVFDPRVVRRELQIIKQDLHCNAVGITATDMRRLMVASSFALEEGLDVWATPTLWEKGEDETIAYLVKAARMLEPLREKWPDRVVMSVGSESTLFMRGIIEGRTLIKRLGNPKLREIVLAGEHNKALNTFLAKAVDAVKKEFHGKLIYKSLIWEKVDWSVFDYVGVDHYRAKDMEAKYVDMLEPLLETGKPVINTGFGYGTYENDGRLAQGLLAGGDIDKTSMFLHHIPVVGRLFRTKVRVVHKRDEAWQARKLFETLDVLDKAGVEGAFVDEFVFQVKTYDDDPRYDLDTASSSIVKSYEGKRGTTYPDMPWEPKQAFKALAEFYASH
jgi:hypothetical protein